MPNIAFSADGVSWVVGPWGILSSRTAVCGVASDGNLTIVLVGSADCGGTGIANNRCNTLGYSTDGGLTFTGLGTAIFDITGHAAAYANGLFVIASGKRPTNVSRTTNGNAVAYSTNGISWTVASTPWLETGLAVVYSALQNV